MTSLFHRRKGFKPKVVRSKTAQPQAKTKQQTHTTADKPHTTNRWIQIESLNHQGAGVGVYSSGSKAGKKVFVRYALPGETVKIALEKEHATYDEARAIKVEQPSSDRVEAPCEFYSVCGGCQLQHLTYSAQLAEKSLRFKNQLQHAFPGLVLNSDSELANIPIAASPETTFKYRRRARLSIPKIKPHEAPYLGFRAASSRQIIPIDQCLVLHPMLNQLLAPLTQLLSLQVGQNNYGHIELLLNEVTAQQAIPCVIIRLLEPLSAQQQNEWENFSKQHHCDVIAQGKNNFEVIAAKSEAPLALGYFVLAQRLVYGPNEFIQVNAEVNQLLIKTALDWLQLTGKEKILELFAGFGNLTFALAPACQEITAVELADLQVQRGLYNAKQLGYNQVNFVKQDLNQPLSAKLQAQAPYDLLVLDPPRAGAEQVMQHLASIQAKQVLYISCDSTTFIRDAQALIQQGYQLKKLALFDMFPQTFHTESMALFTR